MFKNDAADRSGIMWIVALASVAPAFFGCGGATPPANTEVVAPDPVAGEVRADVSTRGHAWDIAPLNISGWDALEAIQAYYPARLRRSGRSADVMFRVCVDKTGAIADIRAVTEGDDSRPADDVVAAALDVLRGYRYLPAWRYVGPSTTRVEPVPGCLRQAVSFYHGQLAKSRHDPSRLGLKFILDGRMVRVWRGGTVLLVDDPRVELSEADITGDMRQAIDAAQIARVYRLGAAEIGERFGYELAQDLFVLETK